MSLTPRRQGIPSEEQLGLWQQIPNSTKLYFAILLGLLLLLGLLIIIRIDLFSFQWKQIKLPSISHLFSLGSEASEPVPTPFPGAARLSGKEDIDIDVYAGPGNVYQKINSLPEGSEAEVIGVSVDGLWWAIKLTDDGKLGWISDGMAEVNDADSLPVLDVNGEAFLSLEAKKPRVIAADNTKIMYGPGPEYGLIGYLEAGQMAEIVGVGENGLWWVIRVPYVEGGKGWILAEQVVKDNVGDVPVVLPEAVSISTETKTLDSRTVTSVANVNVRSGPGLGYNRIGSLTNGQQAEAVGVSEDGFWLAIRAAGELSGQGWVSIDYVIPQGIEGLPVLEMRPETGALVVPTPASGKPTATAWTMVNIRGGAGLQYKVLGRLEPGQQAEILGISPDKSWWVIRVAIEGQKRGWVAVNFVQAKNTSGVRIIR